MTKPRHLLHAFSTFSVGGPEVRTCDLINHFGERYRHTIIAMDNKFDCRSKLQSGAPVELLEIPNYRSNLIKNVRQFSHLLKTLKPDVLLTYNWGAVEWGLAHALTRRCPHIHAEDGFSPEELVTQKKRRVIARRLFLSATNKIVVPSRLLEKIAREIWKFSSSRVSYIPNGVDILKFSRLVSNKPELAKIPDLQEVRNSLIVGTVARLRLEKNIPLLIRAFAKATAGIDAKLVVVGDGDEKPALRQLIQQENLSNKVILLGHFDDPSEVVKTFDIFAISSDTEQMPISVLEGMAAQCPIVGTNVGDIAEMVAPSNQAFLSPPNDEAAFVKNLSQLLADNNLRTRLGQENFQRCQALFDKSLMFSSYEKLYDWQAE